jgi:hypothetical protein
MFVKTVVSLFIPIQSIPMPSKMSVADVMLFRQDTPQQERYQMPKYDVKVRLSGNDGNAFAIMGEVKSALKKAGASKEELDKYLADSMSGDYDNLLRVAMDWVVVK